MITQQATLPQAQLDRAADWLRENTHPVAALALAGRFTSLQRTTELLEGLAERCQDPPSFVSQMIDFRLEEVARQRQERARRVAEELSGGQRPKKADRKPLSPREELSHMIASLEGRWDRFCQAVRKIEADVGSLGDLRPQLEEHRAVCWSRSVRKAADVLEGMDLFPAATVLTREDDRDCDLESDRSALAGLQTAGVDYWIRLLVSVRFEQLNDEYYRRQRVEVTEAVSDVLRIFDLAQSYLTAAEEPALGVTDTAMLAEETMRELGTASDGIENLHKRKGPLEASILDTGLESFQQWIAGEDYFQKNLFAAPEGSRARVILRHLQYRLDQLGRAAERLL